MEIGPLKGISQVVPMLISGCCTPARCHVEGAIGRMGWVPGVTGWGGCGRGVGVWGRAVLGESRQSRRVC